MPGRTVLIVDDEAASRKKIMIALEMAGFICIEASNSHEALIEIVDHQPDMVLLEWMLPGTNGIELARRLRRNENTTELPIIMLSAKADEDNKIHGLEVGADDYIVKPFSPRELVARVKGVLRRTNPQGIDSKVEVEGLLLDPVSHRVSSHNESIKLGPTEYKLLQFFMTHQNRAYTRPQLLDQVWGGNVYVEDRTVDVHIRRLRKSLGNQHDYLVQTVRGTGYRFSTQKAS